MNKPVSMSSDLYESSFPAQNGVDGQDCPNEYEGFFQTSNDKPYVWWRVDLGHLLWVFSVKVFNRHGDEGEKVTR